MENKKESSHELNHHRSKRNKTMDDEALSGETRPNIPQEIIEEILVKLPARSLLKLRCVSKSWLSLITSRKFIKAHVTYSTLDPALSSYRLVSGVSYDPIRDEPKPDSVRSAVVVSGLFADAVMNCDCPSEHSEWGFQINGSCNGLLCVSFHRKVDPTFPREKHTFLWNPCLRMSRKLPPVTAEDAHMITVSEHGIGYDEPNDDYKVAGLFGYLCKVSGLMKLMVQIYSLKNDSWKRIHGFKGAFTKSSPVIFAYGKFHFLESFILGNYSSSIAPRIVSLDLASEAYGTIPQPKHAGKNSFVSIAVLKGCISAVYNYERDRFDVWVLKEYGVVESWTKIVSIPYVDGATRDYRFPFRLCTLWNGKYWMRCGSHRVVYDPRDISFVYPPKGNIAVICSTGIYVESLVTLRRI